jgi:tRNA-modifying protein YgfZ
MSTRYQAEQRAAQGGAVVHVRPDLAAFAVTGGDRLSWLNGLVTQDVGKLAAGRGAYALAVGKTGKILAELWLVAASDRALVVAARDQLDAIRAHFDKHLVMEDAEIGEALDRGVVFAHGPLAEALVDHARGLGADAAMVDFTGRRDAAVMIAPEGADALADAMLARAGDRGARLSDEAWEALRVAWGVPRFGVDLDEQTLPQEAALEKLAVSFQKGCYLGQETVFMLEKRGHARRRLSRVAIEGDEPVAPGAEITSDGAAVGTITSVVDALEGEGKIALGYVKYKLASPGTALVVAGRPARVIGAAAEPLPLA